LILAPRTALIKDFMSEELVVLRHTDEAQAAADLLARYDFIAMPVVDESGGMLGIITHDDVIDILQEEATEDMQRQAAVGPIEGNVLEAPFVTVWWNRAKWLAILFIFQMATINVMRHYEGELEKVVFLMALVPLCLSVGGNAGSQAASLITRAIALEQVAVKDWLRVLKRELLVGFALATSLAVLAVARTYFFTSQTTIDKLTENHHPFSALVWLVPLSVAGICFTGTIVGSMLPLGLKKIGFDPALTSSPFIATLSDVLGIVIFFNIAYQFFF
jgi:magnesium transporter